jgi:benzoyl-CoA reductase/2-hydroxyglutaryl-CoA dehydratase subunit BcrC/BadD/HgdB
MSSLDILRAVAEEPQAAVREWLRNRSGPAVGFSCSYVPEEIIWASGCLPVRLLGHSPSTPRADRHLQAYCCSPVRRMLEDGLSGSLSYLSGAAFAAGCDSMQRLSDIWRINVSNGFHLDLEIPSKLNTPASKHYLQAVLQRFHRQLLDRLGRPFDQAELAQSISLFNRLRRRIQQLARLRRERPGCLSAADFQAVCLAAQVMDRHTCLSLLDDLVNGLEAETMESKTNLPRLIVAGSPCLLPRMMSLIEECSARIVADDLCTAERCFQGQLEEDGEPYMALAKRLASRTPCPAKHAGAHSRIQALRQQVVEARADGVVLVPLKFCDPFGFELPGIQQALADEAIPSLVIEIEEQPCAEEPFRTRCQAFVERLGQAG